MQEISCNYHHHCSLLLVENWAVTSASRLSYPLQLMLPLPKILILSI